MHPAHHPQPPGLPRPKPALALAMTLLRVRTWLPALGLAWAACFSPGLAAQTLRAADIHNSDDYPTVAAVRYMGEWLSQRTGGRLKIKVFNKGALGTEKETIDQVKVGALDITRVNVSPMNALCAQTLVPALPYLFRSVAHMRRALDSPAGAEILRSCEPQGFVGLAFYDSGARSVYARKPLRGLADLQGLKIRVPPSELWVAMTAALGANATPMPLGEVYTGLKTGLIDAAENNVPSFEAFRHDEAARHYTRTEHSMAPEMLLMSKRRFDSLSPADQALVREAARVSVAHQRGLWDAQEARALALLQARGAQFHEIDTAALRARMAPVYARFINTPALQALVKALQEVP